MLTCCVISRRRYVEELTLLKNVLVTNGYPEKLARETFDRFWRTKTLKAILKGWNRR